MEEGIDILGSAVVVTPDKVRGCTGNHSCELPQMVKNIGRSCPYPNVWEKGIRLAQQLL